MRPITTIVLHISDLEWGCVRSIRADHMGPPRNWKDIAYHYCVLNGFGTFDHFKNGTYVPTLDGSIECGRYLDDDSFIEDVEVGAHTLGLNAESIGIVCVGKKTWTPLQWQSAGRLVRDLQKLHSVPTEKVIGHYETTSGKAQGKTCPNIDMHLFRSMLPT